MGRQHFFYCASRLQTCLACTRDVVFLRNGHGLMAELSQASSALLITDSKDSVLHSIGRTPSRTPSYTCYGYETVAEERTSWMGFNGELRAFWASCYSLGNGYRLYSTALMRFSSPDSFSPFGKGGVNAYSYCECDPVNRTDPTGHMIRPRSRSLSSVSFNGQTAQRRRSLNGSLENRYLVQDNGNSRSPTQSPDNRSNGSASSLASSNSKQSPVLRQRHSVAWDQGDVQSTGATSGARSSFSDESDVSTSEVAWPSSGRSSPVQQGGVWLPDAQPRPENLYDAAQDRSPSLAATQVRTGS